MLIAKAYFTRFSPMVLLRNRRGKVNFVAIFTLVCFIFVISTTKAVSQSQISENKLVQAGIQRDISLILMQAGPAPEPTPTIPSESKDKWWIPIVVAMIAALGSVIVAVLNPQFVSAIINPRKKQRSVLINRRLRGLVLDKRTGMGIQGAQISLETEGIPSIQSTDAVGNFLFSFQCPEDIVRVRVSANGYQRYDRLVDFPKGTETLAIEINLSREP